MKEQVIKAVDEFIANGMKTAFTVASKHGVSMDDFWAEYDSREETEGTWAQK